MSNSHIESFVNAITNKISNLISSHNNDGNAHSNLFDGKANVDHSHSQYLTTHQDISGKEDVIELITGTHSSTSTYQMTGISSKNASISNGTRILYKMPVNSTNTSNLRLNLTLSGGGTTGLKYLRLNGSYVKHNQFKQNDILLLEYDGTYWNIINHFNGLLSTVAASGSYNDLSDKPTIPMATSDLINDNGYVADSAFANIVNYELTSNNYTPGINGTFTLTLKVTDIYGNPVPNYNAGTLKENGYDTYDTNGVQIGANMTTDSNGESNVTITCYNLYGEIYMQNGQSEAALWNVRDYSVGDAHCQVQAKGWHYYVNDSYKLSRNGYLARFSLHGWKTGSQATTSSWVKFGGDTAYALNIVPQSHVLMLNSGANLYFRIHTDGTITYKAVGSNVPSQTEQYGMVTWATYK